MEKTERSEDLKKDLITRLNRVEGQIRGINKMIENDTYCDSVLNQILAVKSALNSISNIILENHIKNCFINKLKNGDENVLQEFMTVFKKFMK